MPVSGSTLASAGVLAVAAYSNNPGSQLGGTGWTVLSGSILAAYNPNLTASDFTNGILSVGASEAFVAVNGDTHQIAICYRGTQEPVDFFLDFTSLASTFYPSYYALSELVVAMEAYTAAHLAIEAGLVVGHRLGGALTEIFMDEHPGSFYQAVTFGSPGEHLLPWAANTDPRILNIRHTGDPVVDAVLLDGGVGLDLDVSFPGSSFGTKEHSSLLYQHSAYALATSTFWSQYQASFSNFAVQIGSDGSPASDLGNPPSAWRKMPMI